MKTTFIPFCCCCAGMRGLIPNIDSEERMAQRVSCGRPRRRVPAQQASQQPQRRLARQAAPRGIAGGQHLCDTQISDSGCHERVASSRTINRAQCVCAPRLEAAPCSGRLRADRRSMGTLWMLVCALQETPFEISEGEIRQHRACTRASSVHDHGTGKCSSSLPPGTADPRPPRGREGAAP